MKRCPTFHCCGILDFNVFSYELANGQTQQQYKNVLSHTCHWEYYCSRILKPLGSLLSGVLPFSYLGFFSSYLEVSCFNFQVLWAWKCAVNIFEKTFLYFLLQSYSSRILKPTGCDVKLGGAIFISSIFFSSYFPLIFLSS